MSNICRQDIWGCFCLLSLLLIVFLNFALPSLPARAQLPPGADVDRATKEVDRSLRKEAERRIKPLEERPLEEEEEEGEEEPSEEEKKFFVSKIILVGAEAVPEEKFRPLIEKYEKRNITFEEINVLTKEIEREYLREGIIAACFIPPQDIKEGIITLQVVEAKMGALKIEPHKYFDEKRISHYWAIKRGEVLRYDKMNKSLQLLNKSADREVGITLHAGEEPETTDVLVEAKTSFPLHLFFSFDREGAISTGRRRIGFGIKHNNFTNVDDTLITGLTGGKDFMGLYAYHSIPITNFGTSIMYGHSYSKSSPKKDYENIGLKSEAQNTSFTVSQDLFKGGENIGEISIGMDGNDKVTHTFDGVLNRDRFRIARLKSTLIHQYPGNITYLSPQISQGLNLFGARSNTHLSSRNGTADNNFTKFNLDIRHRKILPLNIQANLNFSMQVASEKLASQEEFSLGGTDSVRGYPAQDFSADHAFRTNVELLIPSFWIPDKVKIPYDAQLLKDAVTTVVFFDQGYGKKKGTLITEKDDASLAGIGAGLRIRLFNQALLRLEWGLPVGDMPDTEKSERGRFHFSVEFEDKLPEEIERIKKEIFEEKVKKLAWKFLNDELKSPGSKLRGKMYNYLTLARLAYENGKLEKAKAYYSKIKETSESLYAQSETYIRESFKHQETLKGYDKQAEEYYEAGDLESAEMLWKKLKKEAKIKPFKLDL